MIKNIYRKTQNAINAVTGIALAVMVLIIFIQVIMRYAFGRSLSWSEELTRYMFVWLLFMGVNLGIRDDLQIKIDILDLKLKGRYYKILKVIQHLLSSIAVIAVFVGSLFLIRVGVYTTSPSNHFPMWIIYLVFPIGMGLNLIELMIKIVMVLQGKEEKEAGV